MGTPLKTPEIEPPEVDHPKRKRQNYTPLFEFDATKYQEVLAFPLGDFLKSRVDANPKNPVALYPKGFTHISNSIICHIAGLYWLEYTIAAGLVGDVFSTAHRQAMMLLEVKTAAIAEFLSLYILTICAGEFRHGMSRATWKVGRKLCSVCKHYYQFQNPETQMSRNGGAQHFWSTVKASKAPTYGAAWETLIHGFTEHSWPGNGIGGAKWGYIAFMGRALWVAWATGDISGMMRYIDFIIHAVHNGANCLNPKFDWYLAKDVHFLGLILNAKFHGHPCCWLSITQHIPAEYRLVNPSTSPETVKLLNPQRVIGGLYNLCTHVGTEIRDLNLEPPEERQFRRMFKVRDVCKDCGAVLGIGGCPKFCKICEVCYDGYHAHVCACGANKLPGAWADPFCPKGCKVCFDLDIARILSLTGGKKLNEPPVFKGCCSIYQYTLGFSTNQVHIPKHKYCHWCNTLMLGHLPCAIEEGHATQQYQTFRVPYLSFCPKVGKCIICIYLADHPEEKAKLTKLKKVLNVVQNKGVELTDE